MNPKDLFQLDRILEMLDASLDDVKAESYGYYQYSDSWTTQSFKFQLDGVELKIDFDLEHYNDTHLINIRFLDLAPPGDYDQYDVIPRDNPAFAGKLFTFIKNTLEDILSSKEGEKVNEIKFSSKATEPSRIKLYRFFSKIIAKEVGGEITETPRAEDVVFYIDFPSRKEKMKESISANYWKNGGPTRNQNRQTSFDDINRGDAGLALSAGFDLNKTTGYTSKGPKYPENEIKMGNIIKEAISKLDELSDIVDTIYDSGIEEDQQDDQTEWYASRHPKSKFIVHEG